MNSSSGPGNVEGIRSVAEGYVENEVPVQASLMPVKPMGGLGKDTAVSRSS